LTSKLPSINTNYRYVYRYGMIWIYIYYVHLCTLCSPQPP
jgi:hypothetical protein